MKKKTKNTEKWNLLFRMLEEIQENQAQLASAIMKNEKEIVIKRNKFK